VATYALRSLGCTWLILGLFTLFFTGIGILYYTRRRPRLFVAKTVQTNGVETPASKIVPLTKDAVLEQK